MKNETQHAGEVLTDEPERKPFLTAEEAIAYLWTLCPEDAPDSKPALKIGDLRQLLNRVNLGNLSDRQVDAGIMEALDRYETNNPQGEGLSFPQIWSFLRRGGENIAFAVVENRITELLAAGKLYPYRGVVTTYRKTPLTEGENV